MSFPVRMIWVAVIPELIWWLKLLMGTIRQYNVNVTVKGL